MQWKMICAGHKLREFTVQIDLLQSAQKFTCHLPLRREFIPFARQ